MKPLLIAMMGLPRSGKSTVVEQLRKDFGAPVVRRDAIRLALHGQRYVSQAEPMVKAISFYMIKSLFLTGHEIVICDETSYSRAARDAIKDPSWDTKFSGQPDLVPVIDEMFNRYEPLGKDEEMLEWRMNLGEVGK